MLRSRQAIATALFLAIVMAASVAVYSLDSESVQREIIVSGVNGQIAGNTGVSLGFYYPQETSGLIFFKQSESFYVFLYLTGQGTVQGVQVTTPGFGGTIIAPNLPLSIDNSTEPSVMILQITVLKCCFNGTVDFAVNTR
jgi:hypothetical protein